MSRQSSSVDSLPKPMVPSSPSGSSELNHEEIQYLSLILNIINSQNWQAFEYAIVNNPRVFQTFARTVMNSSELNGMTILHACVRFNPPPLIVKILLDLNPESTRCVDCLHRTPLHVAAGTRASPLVIEMLARSYPAACAMQDEDGKTPLHLACDSSCELFEEGGDNNDKQVPEDSASRREPPSFEVIKTLIEVCPFAAPLEDRDNMNALEHAIFSDSAIEVVKLLQYATKKVCEKTAAQKEREEQLQLQHSSMDIEGSNTPLGMTVVTRRVSQDSDEMPRPNKMDMMDVDSQEEDDVPRHELDVPIVPARRQEFSKRRRRRGGIVRASESGKVFCT